MITTCPGCKEEGLSPHELEQNLHSTRCGKCSGVWVSSTQYEQWLKHHGPNLPEKPADADVNLESGESHGAKFCPECKYILLKYKVGHNVGFSLNRCGHCGGIWFDRNEWEIMKSRNLNDDVHLVFSEAWQSAVRAEEHKNAVDEILRKQIGDEDLK